MLEETRFPLWILCTLVAIAEGAHELVPEARKLQAGQVVGGYLLLGSPAPLLLLSSVAEKGRRALVSGALCSQRPPLLLLLLLQGRRRMERVRAPPLAAR